MKNRRSLLFILLLAIGMHAAAQPLLVPGANEFEKKWIRNGKSEMGYYTVKDGRMTEICVFSIEILSTPRQLNVYTKLQFLHSNDQWVDTAVSDASNFTPLYRSSYSSDKAYVLRYGKEITGFYHDKKTNTKKVVKEPVTAAFFDNYTYPYLLGLLPLQSGYKKDLPVFEYNPANAGHIKKARIEEVKNNVFVSPLTGEHKVWQVSVLEEASNDRYDYYIGKEDRRIWKIEVRSGSQQLVLLNKEIDYNPFSQQFNKEETLKLITSGSAIISGEVFARDNENEGALKGMAVLNINKKQYAKPGTTVLLIPYTNFFKEWVKLNESSRKKGRSIPLPKEAAACIKVATVYDEMGNFEFVNLMPGDYLLYTEFGYVHTSRRADVVGYTDTYINGMFQGTSANTQVNTYQSNAAASIKKVVTLKKAGEKVEVKLKKTL